MNTHQLNIDLNFQQLLKIVKQLSPSEKLKLNAVIWDETMEIPLEQQKLVLSRKKKSEINPDRMLDWTEASKKLKA